jgi:integrase
MRLVRALDLCRALLTGRRAGTQRGDFRKAWATACQKAGVPGMLRHDLRRPAVRNMVNAGVPERVAMKVTGHRTRSVFDRYHRVGPGDLQDVARRLAGAFSGTPGIRKLLGVP